MKVVDVKAIDVLLPHPEPFESCLFPGVKNRFFEVTLLEIKTDEGIVGYSSNRDRWWDDPARFSKERPSYSRQIIETYLRRYLIGKDPLNIVQHMRVFIHGLKMFHGYPWFIEFALWDILGKAAELPLYKLLGGGKERVRAYCSTASLYEPDEMASKLKPLLDRGFTAIKLRAHRADYREDVEAMEAAREAVGPNVALMVDANQSNMPAYGLVPGSKATPSWDYQTALAFGQMNEPPGTRLRVGLTGLCLAEYFRDEEGKDVLLFIDNIYRFILAGMEVSALLGRMPSAVGYQPTPVSYTHLTLPTN